MPRPANYPLYVRIGDTETVRVKIEDENGDPINIAGRTYTAQIREFPKSETPIATFTCSIEDAANGIFSCVISSTDTADLAPADAYWDLQEQFGQVVTTLLYGEVKIERDVTR